MDLSQAIDHVRPSIVQIMMRTSSPTDPIQTIQRFERPRHIGTGFLVSTEAYLITAKHVIDWARQVAGTIQAQELHIYAGIAQPNTDNFRANFSAVPVAPVAEDADHDLALLKLTANPFKGEVSSGIVIRDEAIPLPYGLAELDDRRPKDGQFIAVSGYPLEEKVMITNAGYVASSWSMNDQSLATEGVLGATTFRGISDIYLADVQANPGNSGGPVYSIEEGKVIGVCVALKGAPVWAEGGVPASIEGRQLFYAARLTMVVPTAYVIDLLRKHGVFH